MLNARSEDILNAVDAAIEDGMDVLNLSLGGSYHGNNDLLAMGLDNAVDAGLVVAVAAGNSGPGQGTLESPGRARKIITVGGSTTSISSASLSRIRRAAEQQSAPQWVTSTRCLQTRSISSTLSRTVAPASIPAPPANWRSLTEARAPSARKSRMPKRQVPLLFSSSTTLLETPLQWLGRQASTMTYPQS